MALYPSTLQVGPYTLQPGLGSLYPHNPQACDVREEASVEALADFAVKGMGGIDIWVNNAGCSQSVKGPCLQTPAHVIRASPLFTGPIP